MEKADVFYGIREDNGEAVLFMKTDGIDLIKTEKSWGKYKNLPDGYYIIMTSMKPVKIENKECFMCVLDEKIRQ